LGLVHLTSFGWIVRLDGRLSEEVTDLRWWPLTHLMEAASSWWVKGPLFVAAALLCEVLIKRSTMRVPAVALVTLTSLLAASLVSTWAKAVFERPRPPLAHVGISAIGQLPSSPSFPSGHAATSFGAAVALAVLVPRVRWWALGLAALVAVSRVYLGMHFTADVAAGAVLGSAVALLVVVAARRLPPVAPHLCVRPTA
jgi:undecaprenyl-diphosphatase